MLATRVVPAPPLTVEGDLLADRQVHYFNAVARLAPGTTLERARAELSSIAARLGERYPQTNRGQGFGAIPLKELVTSETRAGLFILLGAVAFVLLVACANVASLLLARATGRRQELATRAALGAGRAQLVRQLLVESLLVGLAGGCLGLLLASWGLDGLVALLPDDVPRLWEVRLDATVTVFTLALGAATALVFGILPALQASRTDLVAGLRAGELRAGGAGAGRALSALVVVEVVSGVVLCVGAGLMVNTLLRLERVDPGYRTEGVVRVPLPLPSTRYATGPQQGEFYGRVLEKLAANPLTRLSAAAFPLPLTNAGASGGVQVEGRPWSTDRERPVAAITWVSPGYFAVMGIPMRRGRDLDARDVKGSTPVAVISDTMASRLWPGEDAIGRRFSFGDPNDHTWITVVGVVGDVRHEAAVLVPDLDALHSDDRRIRCRSCPSRSGRTLARAGLRKPSARRSASSIPSCQWTMRRSSRPRSPALWAARACARGCCRGSLPPPCCWRRSACTACSLTASPGGGGKLASGSPSAPPRPTSSAR